ncbi:MAG: 4-(cytidine 5'-diphospho)-2-C-methyl-D-erythritol kinase [Paracoccaceae bacterium]
MKKVEAFAPAKINLTLHVTGQRADGYHLLDSLVVFADIGDRVTAKAGDALSLCITGEQAGSLLVDDSNLTLMAARLLHPSRGAALELEKNLPISSGIGGGSSDAAATLRALSDLWSVELPVAVATQALGADVPVCMSSCPQRMQGIGERLGAVDTVPPMAVVLINPRKQVSTPAVFRDLAKKDNPPMAENLPRWNGFHEFVSWISAQRNDLESPAINQVPEISEICTVLRQTGASVSRMSGSGATCFGLFSNVELAQTAATKIRAAHPSWWIKAGQVLDGSEGA